MRNDDQAEQEAMEVPAGALAALPSAETASPDYAGMLRRVAAGDRQAETELVLTLSEPLALVLRRRVRQPELCADLQQDTLMVVLTAAREGRIAEPRALIDFTLETARRLALNLSRKSDRQRTDVDLDAIDGTADRQLPVLDTLAGEELRHCVRTVLAALNNERDRQVLHSYYIEEQPSAQVQARFALDSVQLGRVLHRARQRFHAMWQALRIDIPEV